MNSFKVDHMRSFFLSLIATILLSIAIPTVWANPGLIKAIEEGDIETVRQLIEEGVDPNKVIHDDDGLILFPNALNMAAAYGHSDIVRLLIQCGMNPDNFTTESPLHIAASYGHLPVVRMLIEEYNADPLTLSAASYGQKLPLHYAAAGDNSEVVQYLLDRAPGTANYSSSPDNPSYSKTPLEAAFETFADNNQIVQLLIEHGADSITNGLEFLSLAAMTGKSITFALIFNQPEFNRDLINSRVDNHDNSFLHIACMHRSTSIVKVILESHDFDHNLVNMPNFEGQTPLQLSGDDPEIKALLIEHGATLEEQAKSVSPDNKENQQNKAAASSDDPGLTISSRERSIVSLSVNTEPGETQPLSEELSLNENATGISETLSSSSTGMGLTGFFPPTSH